MSLRMKTSESLAHGVRRIARQRVRSALGALEHEAVLPAVHAARVQLKKIRALVRLLHGTVGGKRPRTAERSVRRAADLLAGLRDVHAALTAVERLASGHPRGRVAPLLNALATDLRKSTAATARQFALSGDRERILARLDRLSSQLDGLKTGGPKWRGRGLKRAYRRARRAFRDARGAPTPNALHRWRKRTKELACLVRVLPHAKAEAIERLHADLKHVAGLLGEHHDLVVLRDALPGLPPTAARAASRSVTTVIDQQLARRCNQALHAGAALFVARPAVFQARVRRAPDRRD